MKIKQLLNNKAELMGFSTLLVLFAHISIIYSWTVYIQRLCSCSIDIFLIVSGMGCYYSIQKNSIKKFISHRLYRILPIYLLVLLCYGLYAYFYWHQSVDYFLLHNEAFTSLFLYGEITGWFVVAIILFYVATPFLNKLINNKWYYTIWLMIGVWVCSAQLEFYTQGSLYMINNFIISRFPAYILGMLLGYWLRIDKEAVISNKIVYICEILFILLMLTNLIFNKVNSGYIMKIISTPLGFFTTLLFTKLCTNKLLNNILKFFGSISLEVYLIFEKVLNIIIWDTKFTNIMEINIIAIVITIIIAAFLKYILSFKK